MAKFIIITKCFSCPHTMVHFCNLNKKVIKDDKIVAPHCPLIDLPDSDSLNNGTGVENCYPSTGLTHGTNSNKSEQLKILIKSLEKYGKEKFMNQYSDEGFILDVIYFLGLSFDKVKFGFHKGMTEFVKAVKEALKRYPDDKHLTIK